MRIGYSCGGRIRHMNNNEISSCPVVMPKTGHVTNLLVEHFHKLVNHQGKGLTLNEIRSNGYWVVNANAIVARHIYRCVTCRKHRGKLQSQKMADLPSDRTEPAPPFSHCSVDFFGSFLMKQGRKQIKRWGVIFSCLASRAVHIEISNSLDTSSFICALRRFLAIRGPISVLRCDRGTNFIGASRELKEVLENIDDERIREFLNKHNCEIDFKHNVPDASHMGGAWERMIRSIRSILNVMMANHSEQLDDELLRTYMYEVMAVINSRPLTIETLNDPTLLTPLTPNHLIMMKTSIVLPPPGEFQRDDMYCRKRWRRVQYLIDQFWSRWKKEYLQILQNRQKWTKERRNVRIGDVVLLKDDSLPRNNWPLCRVVEANASSDGLVRTIKLQVGDPNLTKIGKRTNKTTYLERPIHKIVVLVENNL